MMGVDRQVEIIAHRGASAHAPENTLAAVLLAWKLGADAVEVDVRMSADRKVLVLHDETTRRTALVNHRASEELYSVLQTLDVGSWKGEEFRGERIPLLEEVICTVPPGKRLFVEIKAGLEIVAPLLDLIDRDPRPERIALISFGFEVLREVKRRWPDQACYWLLEGLDLSILGESGAVEKAVEARFDGIDLLSTDLAPRFARRVHAAGLKLCVWTVNTPREARRCLRHGVDGITTDWPGDLRRWLS